MKEQYHFWNFADNVRKIGISNAIEYDLERTLEQDKNPLELKTVLKNTLKLPINLVLLAFLTPVAFYNQSQRAADKFWEEDCKRNYKELSA